MSAAAKSFAAESSGSAGAANGAGSSSVDVDGRLYWLDSNTFAIDASRPFVAGASVSMLRASDQTLTTVTASSGRFSLDGVLGHELSFVATAPDSGSIALSTLAWIDTLASQEVAVPVVSADVLDEAFAVVTTPEPRDGNAAQVVLRFTLENKRAGLAGVKLEPAGDGKVLYDAGGSWSDGDQGSGNRGLVLIQNLSVAGAGAQPLSIRFAADSSFSDGLGLSVAAGMVTYFDVIVAK